MSYTTIQLKTLVDLYKPKTKHASYVYSNGKKFYNGLPTADATYLLDGNGGIVYDGENMPVEVITIYPEYVGA